MRASIVIAAHNEGDLLWRTVRSCIESTAGLGYEIVVADDASTDGSLENLRGSLKRWRERHPGIRLPTLRLLAHRKRRGVSPGRASIGA